METGIHRFVILLKINVHIKLESLLSLFLQTSGKPMLKFHPISNERLGRKLPSLLEREIAATALVKRNLLNNFK